MTHFPLWTTVLQYLFNEPDFMDKYGDSLYFSYCLKIPSKDQNSTECIFLTSSACVSQP